MAGKRLLMRKSREILRQKWELHLSHRQVARSPGVGVGTVSAALQRARAANLGDWATVQAFDEATLEQRLYGRGLLISRFSVRFRVGPLFDAPRRSKPGSCCRAFQEHVGGNVKQLAELPDLRQREVPLPREA